MGKTTEASCATKGGPGAVEDATRRGTLAAESMRRVSLIFPAYNRLEFTRAAWAALMANTNWDLVSEFHVYDDGSTDGTREWLRNARGMALDSEDGPMELQWHDTTFRSPMGITLDWIRRSAAPILAKLDNDTVYPPGWLDIALSVMDRHPELDMLGLECMREPARFRDESPIVIGYTGRENYLAIEFSYLPAQFISGLGLYRRSVFTGSLPADNGYFGLEEWQAARSIKAGWILPSLPTILLDRLPFEPWCSLSEEYVRRGWQRPWSGAGPLRYKPEQHAIWDWWWNK